MNLWEFLYQATFWQWIGLILLVNAIAEGIGEVFRNTIKRKD